MSFKCTLPGFYIDLVESIDPITSIVLTNRDPEPEEQYIKINQKLYFDLISVNGPPVDFLSIEVWINGILVDLNAEAFCCDVITNTGCKVKNLTGDIIHVSQPLYGQSCIEIPGGYRCAYEHSGGWEPNSTVNVRIVATNGIETLDQSYEFYIEDLIAPVIQNVIPWDRKKIRVIFNEPITLESSSGLFDGLNINNWIIENANDTEHPVASLHVVSVTKFNEYTVDIETDIEQSIGGAYRLIPINITDLFGNIVTYESSSLFFGFIPLVPSKRRWDLLQFLPEISVQEDEGIWDLHRLIRTWQDITDLILGYVDDWQKIIDPNTMPSEFLDLALYDLGNPFDIPMTDDQKRRLIVSLVDLYKLKGTEPGLIAFVKAFIGITITDVVEYNSDGMELGVSLLEYDWELNPSTSFAKYSFLLQTDEQLTNEQKDLLYEIVNYVKPAHTHYIGVISDEDDDVINHWSLGISELGINTILHGV